MVDGDSVTGPLWYFQSIGQGGDIIIVNANMLVLDWYVANMNKRYPEIINLGLTNINDSNVAIRRDKRLLSLIEKNLADHNIYIAVYFSNNLIQAKKFELFPTGILYQVFPEDNLNMAQALEDSDWYWNNYVMRDVKKSKNYSFQVNAITEYYVIMLNNLGSFYFKNNQPQQALKYFEQAITVDPFNVLTNNNLKIIKKYIQEQS